MFYVDKLIHQMDVRPLIGIANYLKARGPLKLHT